MRFIGSEEIAPWASPPDQVQSNDYSCNPADLTFTVWDHIAVYQGDSLVVGCVVPHHSAKAAQAAKPLSAAARA